MGDNQNSRPRCLTKGCYQLLEHGVPSRQGFAVTEGARRATGVTAAQLVAWPGGAARPVVQDDPSPSAAPHSLGRSSCPRSTEPFFFSAQAWINPRRKKRRARMAQEPFSRGHPYLGYPRFSLGGSDLDVVDGVGDELGTPTTPIASFGCMKARHLPCYESAPTAATSSLSVPSRQAYTSFLAIIARHSLIRRWSVRS